MTEPAPTEPPKITQRQKHLTPQQETYVCQFIQARVAAMLSCAPINEQEAEEHLRLAYHALGYDAPSIRWFDSPVAFLRALAASNGALLEDYLNEMAREIIEDEDGGYGFYTLEGIFRLMFIDHVKGHMRNTLWLDIENQVSCWNPFDSRLVRLPHFQLFLFRESGEGHTKDFLAGHPSESIRAWAWTCPAWSVIAYRFQGWLSEYSLIHEIFEPNSLVHFARFNEMVSGYYLGKQEAWMVRKPVRLECDEQGRLHSEHGKAVHYRDGWGFYAWHGVQVPEKVACCPQELTSEDWLELTSEDWFWFGGHGLEVWRVIQERLPNFVEHIGSQCIDTGTQGALYAVGLDDDPKQVLHFVRVQDPQAEHELFLPVLVSVRNADEAATWALKRWLEHPPKQLAEAGAGPSPRIGWLGRLWQLLSRRRTNRPLQ